MKTTGKDKSKINLCIDIILLLLMMAIAGLGILGAVEALLNQVGIKYAPE